MEDFLGILVVVFFYLIAAASGKKKKGKKQQSRQNQSSRRQRGFEQAFGQNAQISMEELAKRLSVQAEGSARTGASDAMECREQRMHLHEATQQQMHLAGEGEDPCHAGGAPELNADESHFSYDEQEAQQHELAQDVLRGVIMSEILTRPCDRAAIKRGRRSAV